jgi:cysteinyl-tRNA synthetase
VREAPERVLSAMDNDLNTSVALSVIGELARVGNEIVRDVSRLRKDPGALAAVRSLAAAAVASLDASCKPLGLLEGPVGGVGSAASQFFARTQARRLRLRGLDKSAVEAKVAARDAAREAKDFTRADAIRAELASLGVEVQDTPGGGATTWRVAV